MLRGLRSRTGWGIAVTAAAFAFGAGPARAATLVVTTTNDAVVTGDGQCSLREAIIAVDSPGSTGDCGTTDATQNTIVLGRHSYTLSLPPSGSDDGASGDLNLTSAVGGLTIAGAGVNSTTISSSGLGDRLLNLATGASATLHDLSLTGGHAPDGTVGTSGNSGLVTAGGAGRGGGAILNAGTLTLNGVTITRNMAGSGGAGGTGGLSNASGGSGGAGGAGGAVLNTGTLTVTDSTISANRSGDGGRGGTGVPSGGSGAGGGAGGGGGGIANAGGTLNIDHSTISQNLAGNGGSGGMGGSPTSPSTTGGTGGTGGPGASGGGVSSVTGPLSIQSSTITGNLAGAGGNGGDGGIIGQPPAVDGAGGVAGDAGDGGGVFAFDGTQSAGLSFVTIAANQLSGPGTPGVGGAGAGVSGAPGQAAAGGGLYTPGGAAASVMASVFASNAVDNCGGTAPTDLFSNISLGAAGCPDGFTPGDPRLGPLRDNGGPTETMALGPGSVAINHAFGGPHTGQCFGADQRGVGRSRDGCDSGAYQSTLPAASVPTVTAVTTTSAALSSTVTANQTSATAYFNYDPASALGASTSVQTVPGFQQPTTLTATLTGLTPATTYHVRVFATSSDGTAASADTTFTTAAVPVPPGGTTPPVPTSTTPGLSHATLRPSAFLAAPQRGYRTGTTITYIDSLAAQTTLTALRIEPGVRNGRRCVAPKRHSRARRCTRLVKIGSFMHRDRVRNNRVRFNGRLRGRALGPGRYRLEITPRLGTLTGKVRTLAFRVLAPPRRRR